MGTHGNSACQQTHSLVKNRLINILPDKIRMVHGTELPGMRNAARRDRSSPSAGIYKRRDPLFFSEICCGAGHRKACCKPKPRAEVRFSTPLWKRFNSPKTTRIKKIVFFAVGFELLLQPMPCPFCTPNSTAENYSSSPPHVLVPPPCAPCSKTKKARSTATWAPATSAR